MATMAAPRRAPAIAAETAHSGLCLPTPVCTKACLTCACGTFFPGELRQWLGCLH